MSNTIEHTATMPHDASDASVGARAGFWRRVFAFLIDTLIISVVFQLLVAVLFFTTSGRVQILGDLSYTSCAELPAVPSGLTPTPPAGLNYARQCNVTFFGIPTAKILQVGQAAEPVPAKAATAKKSASKADIKKTYLLDRDGRPVDGILLEWLAGLGLILYIIAMETRSGATLGGRAMGIRLIDAAAPAGAGVPLRKVLLRYAAMLIGVLPIAFVMLIYFGLYAAPGEPAAGLAKQTGQDTLFSELNSHGLQWQPFLSSYLIDLSGLPDFMDLGDLEWLYAIADLALRLWMIFLVVQIVRRRDPVYDRIAGTSVVRA